MNRDEKVFDKLNMLEVEGTLDKISIKKATDFYEWLKNEYPDSYISSMMISHIAIVFQRVLDNEQIEFSDVEYKMPLSDEQNLARNQIIGRINQAVKKDISQAEINYLDVHIRNFIYDNL